MTAPGPRTWGFPWVIVGLLAALCGCGEGAAPASVDCRFGRERRIATAGAYAFDALSLVSVGGEHVALWSQPTGLFGRRVRADGAPVGAAVALGPRCRGGMDAVAVADRIHIACLDVPHRLPNAVPGPQGEVPGAPVAPRLLWLVREHAPGLPPAGPVRVVAAVGVASTGVALAGPGPGSTSAADAGASVLWAAWRDVHGVHEAVRLLALGPAVGSALGSVPGPAAADAPEGAAKTLSSPGVAVGPPTLRVAPTGPEVVWAERALAGQTWQRALWLAGVDGRRKRLADTAADAPRPVWLPGPPERAALAYRGRLRGLYVAELGVEGKLGRRTRVARADGTARPAFAACPVGLIAATPRRYAGDDFVGINVLDASYARRTPERQFYEDAHGFASAAVTCSTGGALLLIGERARFQHPRVVLRTVPLQCE